MIKEKRGEHQRKKRKSRDLAKKSCVRTDMFVYIAFILLYAQIVLLVQQ